MCGNTERCRFMLFAGTTEGRELSVFMSDNAIPVKVYTATEYGANILRESGIIESDDGTTGLILHAGRLDEAAVMKEIIEIKPVAVIDATHPYAEEVSRAVKLCCSQTNTILLRIRRPQQSLPEGGYITRTKNVAEAAQYLRTKNGNVFLTIGSRQIDIFCKEFLRKNNENEPLGRLCVRVLPLMESIQSCLTCGIKRSNIIAAEGPFTEEMNIACIHHFNASFLVTKETGKEGGMNEKLSAAKKAGIEVVTIARPQDSGGINIEEAKKEIIMLWNKHKI